MYNIEKLFNSRGIGCAHVRVASVNSGASRGQDWKWMDLVKRNETEGHLRLNMIYFHARLHGDFYFYACRLLVVSRMSKEIA